MPFGRPVAAQEVHQTKTPPLHSKRPPLRGAVGLCWRPSQRLFQRPEKLGNASLFTKLLFTIFVPLDPPLPTSKVMEFLLNFD